MWKKIHTGYAFFIFGCVFILLLPLFCIPIIFPRLFRLTGIINRWWSRIFFTCSCISYRVEMRGDLNPKKSYIFCTNHFSYLDIPTMGLIPINSLFVGKSSLQKVPLFGFMYRQLHITVNRSKMKSRGNSLRSMLRGIEQGKNLIIFPEGGMVSKNPPQMSPFLDGAFRVAIEKQIDIVPVTLVNNWKILSGMDGLMNTQHGPVKMIIHRSIPTTGKDMTHLSDLKQTVRDILQTELNRSI